VLYENYELKLSMKLAQTVKLLTCIWEMIRFSINWNADYPGHGFSWVSSSSPGKYRYITSHVLSNSSFINSPYGWRHRDLVWNTGSAVKWATKIDWHLTFFSGVGLSPLGTAATSGLLYNTQVIDEGDYGAIGGMKIVRGNRSTRRKPAPAPFCPPQIPHDQTRARTRAAAVGSQRLTVWAMARSWSLPYCMCHSSHVTPEP
jgi:hypothetical protein